MKEFIDEYIRMKEEIKSYKEKEKIDKIELMREAYKKLINTGSGGIYDKSRRYENLIKCIKEQYNKVKNKKVRDCLDELLRVDNDVLYYDCGNNFEFENKE